MDDEMTPREEIAGLRADLRIEREENARLRRVLEGIRSLPYVGRDAEAQMRVLAGAALPPRLKATDNRSFPLNLDKGRS